LQTLAFPEIAPGCAGVPLLDITLTLLVAEAPQLLLAETVMSPLVEDAVALMEVEVEVPLHPDGKVHE
jgi:hypothetical protein